jgi:Ala-tRNA(Pro) deacylase
MNLIRRHKVNCKDRLEAYLRENQVPYNIHHHPTAYTARDVAAQEHILGWLLAKVVIVIADGRMSMLVLPAPEHVHLPEVARVRGAREVRLADEREFATAFPDCEVGAMPPFGNLYNMPVFVDTTLAAEETIFFQAGTHTDTMSMKYADFARLVKPTVIPFSLEVLRYVG